MDNRAWPSVAKLSLTLILLIVITAASVALLSILREEQSLHSEMEQQATLILNNLSVAAADVLSPLDTDRLAYLTAGFQGTSAVRFAYFYDAEGRLIGESFDEAGDESFQADACERLLLESEAVVLEWQPDQLVAGRAVIADGQLLGTVCLGLSTEPLNAKVSVARNQGIGVLLAVVAVGTLLAVLASRVLVTSLQGPRSAVVRTPEEDHAELPSAGVDKPVVSVTARAEEAAELQGGVVQDKAIIEAIFDGVVSIDQQGQILEFNPAAERMFGYQRTEVSKLRITDLIARESLREKPSHNVTYYLARGRGSLFGRPIEAVAIRADGSNFPIEWAISRIGSTEPPRFVLIIRDVTRRKLAESQLLQAKEAAEAASRAKSSFLANMSHELRTPLSAVIGYTEMLREEAEDRGYVDMLPDLGKIQTAGNQLLSTISDILDLSKIEAGKMELHLETFDLSLLIQELVTTSRPLAEKNGSILSVDCHDHIGTMYADRTKVQQILLNLLDNAAKFTHQGSITLTVTREPAGPKDQAGSVAFVSFRVADTGIGMTQAQLDQLFQPFVQGDNEISREYGGTGLGLTICQRFCQLMGGGIHVESAVDEGSVFTVRLPAVVVHEASNS
jgi:PAS domain S-box-containing protein